MPLSRYCLAFLLFPALGFGQLRLFVVQGGSERAVQPLQDLGSIPVGDLADITFRALNESTVPVTLERLAVAGTAFSIAVQPRLPQSVPAGGAAEFVVRFEPAGTGAHSAGLSVNQASYILHATASAALTVSVEIDGVRRVLRSGAEVDFGNVNVGSTVSRRFIVENRTAGALPALLEATGPAFRVSASDFPANLGPGQSTVFEVAFSPPQAALSTGSLRVGGRSFVLRGTGAEPPLPPLRISVSPISLASGQQVGVTISLESPALMRATGRLTLSFTPDDPQLPDDPMVQFAAGGRSVTFEIPAGENSTEARLQTGTTAGTLVLRAEGPGRVEESRITIPRAAVRVSATRAVRNGSSLDVQITGFDNTRTAAQVAFTFLDSAGVQIAQPVRVDAGEGFRNYFRTSTAGGTFSLRAVFPVTGDAGQVSAVEVEIVNSSGTARSERARF